MSLPEDDAAFTAAILQRLLADQVAGRPGTLEGYCAYYPGREGLVKKAWDEVHSGTDSATAAEDERPLGAPGDGKDAARGEDGAARTIPPVVAGRYEIIDKLGGGGQGEVYLALDRHLGRKVALKLLRGLGGILGDALKRFRREAEVASRLDHPGICQVFDSGVADGVPFIAMRHVEGITLSQEIASATRTDLARTTLLIEQAARALHHAHASGVLHRDIKPANIMITKDHQPVILDFGIARSTDSDDTLRTKTGDIFGTPAYIAPELIETPPAPPDPRSDVYSLGVTLYEAITRHRPFEGGTRESLYRAILRDEPADPASHVRGLPRDLRVIILTAIDKSRERRYESALALAEDLRRFRAYEPIHARPAGPMLRLGRWASRDPMRAALYGLLVLVVAGSALLAIRWQEIQGSLDSARHERERADLEQLVDDAFDALADLKVPKALELFDSVLEREPARLEALAGKSLTCVQGSDWKGALATLDGRPGAESPLLQRARADVLWRVGRAPEAAEIEARLPSPETPLEIHIAALPHIAHGEAGEAAQARLGLELMQRCVLESRKPRAYHVFHLAWAAMLAGDEAECRRISKMLETRWPDRARAWHWSASVLMSWDRAGALNACRKSLAMEPGSNSHLLLLAKLHHLNGEDAESIRIATEVSAANPADGLSQLLLGTIRMDRSEDAEARASLERARAALPEFTPIHTRLGIVLLRNRMFREAEESFREAVRITPGLTSGWNNLALVHYQMGRTAEAREAATRALALSPQQPEARCVLGMCMERDEDYEGAVRELSAARAGKVDYTQAVAHLSMCLFHLKRYREARDMIREADAIVKRVGKTAEMPANIVAAIERMGTLEDRLDDFIHGRALPADPAQLIDLANFAREKPLSAVAARLFEQAFQAKPALKPDSIFDAAQAAALAAAEVLDVSDPDRASAREHWKETALGWLREALAILEDSVDSGKTNPRRAGAMLEFWLAHPAFTPIRDDASPLWLRVQSLSTSWGG